MEENLDLFLLVPPAPKSPREIKSYHLIDLSGLDSPQTHRKADSLPSFESSLLESTFHSVAKQDLGRPAFVPIPSLFSLMIHNVITFCLVITEWDNLVSKQTSRSHYEELLQVRLGCKVKDLKVILSGKVFNTVYFFCQLNGEFSMKNGEQNGGRGVVLRARGCGGSSATTNGTNVW